MNLNELDIFNSDEDDGVISKKFFFKRQEELKKELTLNINGLPEKQNPSLDDVILIEDKDDNFQKKKVTIKNFPGSHDIDLDAIHKNASNEISQLQEKTILNNNDIVLIENSENNYNKAKIKIKSILKNNIIISFSAEQFRMNFQYIPELQFFSTGSNNSQIIELGLAFDSTLNEKVSQKFTIPDNLDLNDTLYFDIIGFNPSTNSGTVVFVLQLIGVSSGENLYGNGNIINKTITFSSNGQYVITKNTISDTLLNLNLRPGDDVIFNLYRNGGTLVNDWVLTKFIVRL